MMDKVGQRKGCFVAVVGPSGAGKDTVLNAAREALKADDRFHFARRVITRPQNGGNEDHISTDSASFKEAIHGGEFALHWQAHGLYYGLSSGLDVQIDAGAVVIANISRQVLADARQRYSSFHGVMITAAPQVLSERLASRRRESADEIEARLARETSLDSSIGDLFTIDNSGELQRAIDLFLSHLMRIGDMHASQTGLARAVRG